MVFLHTTNTRNDHEKNPSLPDSPSRAGCLRGLRADHQSPRRRQIQCRHGRCHHDRRRRPRSQDPLLQTRRSRGPEPGPHAEFLRQHLLDQPAERVELAAGGGIRHQALRGRNQRQRPHAQGRKIPLRLQRAQGHHDRSEKGRHRNHLHHRQRVRRSAPRGPVGNLPRAQRRRALLPGQGGRARQQHGRTALRVPVRRRLVRDGRSPREPQDQRRRQGLARLLRQRPPLREEVPGPQDRTGRSRRSGNPGLRQPRQDFRRD